LCTSCGPFIILPNYVTLPKEGGKNIVKTIATVSMDGYRSVMFTDHGGHQYQVNERVVEYSFKAINKKSESLDSQYIHIRSNLDTYWVTDGSWNPFKLAAPKHYYLIYNNKYRLKKSYYCSYSLTGLFLLHCPRLLLDQPLFFPTEPVRKTVGEIKSFHSSTYRNAEGFLWSGYKTIFFTQGINKKAEKEIYVNYATKKTLRKNPQIKIGTYFEVEYLHGNKEQCIIYWNRPIPADSVQARQAYYDQWNQQQDSIAKINRVAIPVNPHNIPQHHKGAK